MNQIGHNGGPDIRPQVEDDEDNPGNWFAVSRTIWDHPIVGIHDRAYTETEAWLWLISMAAYMPKKVSNKGSVVVIDPGQLMAAHSFLMNRWQWTFAKVRHFLKKLETEAMITRFCNEQPQNRNNQIQIITISKYTVYQKVHDPQQQANNKQATSEQQPNDKPAASEQQANDKNLTLKHLNKETRKEEPPADSQAPSEHAPVNGTHAAIVNGSDAPAIKITRPRRGTRLPEDWLLPQSWGQWAVDNFKVTEDRVRSEADRFKNYWLAKAGKDAVKLDWKRTWMNWCESPILAWPTRMNPNGHEAMRLQSEAASYSNIWDEAKALLGGEHDA